MVQGGGDAGVVEVGERSAQRVNKKRGMGFYDT
jgi:hypothetical protein